MSVKVVNQMTKEEGKRFNNALRWEDLRYNNSYGYHRIIDFTGCRGYIYGEDPDEYLKLVVKCYKKYCAMYPDEAKRRQKRRKGVDYKLFREEIGEFLSTMILGEPRVISEMDEVRAEALAYDARRTRELRKTEFRRICEEQGLTKFFK